MAKRYNLFIDGQNVPITYIPEIMDYCATTGYDQEDARLYASTAEITKIISAHGTSLADFDIDPVPVRCKPRKNSVDIRIAVDVIEEAVEDTDSDVVIVATNDSDFTHVASRVISYKSEFHLLYTGGNAPTGYSQRVVMTPLKKRASRGAQIVEKVKRVAAIVAARQPAQARPRPAAVFEPDPAYDHAVPIGQLSRAGFVMRILATSPVVVDSRSLFRAWRDHSGKAWKGKASKKTPQAFFDEHFPGAGYLFHEWPQLPQNQGYFLKTGYGSLVAPEGFRNPALSLIGAESRLLALQCEVIARLLRTAGYESFDQLYDSATAENLLPRYGAWALYDAWRKMGAPGHPLPPGNGPIAADPAADAAQLQRCFEQEVRRQFEAGEVALEIPDGSGETPANGD